MRPVLAMLLLSACAPDSYVTAFPVAQGTSISVPTLYTYPMPLCLLICTSHISVIREDALATGGGSVSTGSKSNAQTSTGGSGTVTQ